jgi:hypothetical protein
MTKNRKRTIRLLAGLATLVLAYFWLGPESLLGAPLIVGDIDDADDDDPGDAGGADEPDYDVPDGVAGDDDPDGDDPNARSAAGTDDDPNPDAGEGGDGGDQGDDRRMIPAYRLRQLHERHQRELEAVNQRAERFERMIATVLNGQQPEGRTPDGQAVFTPKQQHLREEVLNLLPEVRKLMALVGREKEILDLTARAGETAQAEEQRWTNVADMTRERLTTHVARELGQKALHSDAQAVVVDAFVTWVKADKSGRRNHRYEAQDSALINDFWTFYNGRFRGPAERKPNADALRRSAQQRNLPRGGNTNRVPPPAPRRRTAEDDDPFEAANSQAWRQLQDDQAAAR